MVITAVQKTDQDRQLSAWDAVRGDWKCDVREEQEAEPNASEPCGQELVTK